MRGARFFAKKSGRIKEKEICDEINSYKKDLHRKHLSGGDRQELFGHQERCRRFLICPHMTRMDAAASDMVMVAASRIW